LKDGVTNAPTLRVRPADPACTVCRGQGSDCLLCSPAGVSSLVQFGLSLIRHKQLVRTAFATVIERLRSRTLWAAGPVVVVHNWPRH